MQAANCVRPVATAGAIAVMLLSVHATAKPPRWSLKLESGAEYDNNVHRVEEGQGVVGSPLLRGGVRAQLGWRPVRGQRLSVDTRLQAKLFSDGIAQSENVAVVAGGARYDYVVPKRQAELSLGISYYDAFHYDVGRDSAPVDDSGVRNFRFASAEAQLRLIRDGDHEVGALLGYRSFRLKSNGRFDWDGDTYGVVYQTSKAFGEAEDAGLLDVNLGYRIGRRHYDDNVLIAVPGMMMERGVAPLIGVKRSDLSHYVSAESVYTAERVWSARYELRVIDSNSLGRSQVRQRLEVGVTTELWGRVIADVQAAVQLDLFSDEGVPSDDQAQTLISIDDENRNSIGVHLTRDFTECKRRRKRCRKWAVEGRYAVFANEFTPLDSQFRRQTVYLGLVYSDDP